MPAISDALKFTFLHALAGTYRTFGVAWYRAPGDEGRANGRHLEWRDEVAWRQLDDELHAGFATLPERSIATLKRATIWPKGTLFHREPMPSRMERSAWGTRQRSVLEGADIVFLDPDNGVGDETKKHAAFSEVRLLRKPGRAVVFITFPGRSTTHDALLRQLHERLTVEADTGNVVTLRTYVSVPRTEGSRLLGPLDQLDAVPAVTRDGKLTLALPCDRALPVSLAERFYAAFVDAVALT